MLESELTECPPPLIQCHDLDPREWHRPEMDFPNEPWFEGRMTLASFLLPVWKLMERYKDSYWNGVWHS